MKAIALALMFPAGLLAAHLAGLIAADSPPAPAPDAAVPENPNIDFPGHLQVAAEAERHRAERRLSEVDFIKASQEKGVIVLDARSKEKFDLLHIQGAINLSFPDIDIESLKKTLPNKDTKILIYCNNNFTVAGPTASGDPPGGVRGKAAAAFPGKGPVASLNISTYITLYGYGYKNVYELGPVLDPTQTKLTLVSSMK